MGCGLSTDKALFDNIISKGRPGLESRYSEPKNIFSDTVGRIMSGYSPRFQVPSVQLLEGLNLERMLAIYKERFANAGDFTFVFTGSFDREKIRPLLERYLASLPAKGEHEKAMDHHAYPPKGRIEKSVFKGKEDRATVQMVYAGDFDYSRSDAVAMSALGSVLQLRITERLRMLESGVYSPSVNAGAAKFPSRYSVSIGFGCAPSRVSDLIAAAEQEVGRLRQEGPTAEELQKFAIAQQLGWEAGIKQNGFWLNSVAARIQNGEDLNELLTTPELVKSVTPEMVKTVAQKYLNKDNVMLFKLMPEGKL